MSPSPITLKGRRFELGSRTYVMGILNLTPDSFSGDGLLSQSKDARDALLFRAETMLNDGADILDIGAESSRPGAEKISEQEELDRIGSTISALNSRFNAVISIDSWKANVVATALEQGASIINDIWALRADPKMAEVARNSNAALVLMHNSSSSDKFEVDAKLGASYTASSADDIVKRVTADLNASAKHAIAYGIKRENILLDPGFGFGKSVEQNLELLNRLNELCAMGFPIVSGPSRKSFVGHVLDLPVAERLEGTLAAVALSVDRGASIVRVHDVGAAKRVVTFADAVKQVGRA